MPRTVCCFRFSVLSVGLTIILATPPVRAQYIVLDVTSIAAQAGFERATFTDLNNRGAVAGFSASLDMSQGIYYSAPGFFVLKNGSLSTYRLHSEWSFPDGAYDINDGGTVVGSANFPGPTMFSTVGRSYTWQAGNVALIPDLDPASTTQPGPKAINNAGQFIVQDRSRSLLGQADGSWIQLAVPPGAVNTLIAPGFNGNGINDAGAVVGVTAFSFLSSKATVWVAGQPSVLPTSNPDYQSVAYSINNRGQVVGREGNFTGRAVLWQGGKVIPLTARQSEAYDINELGHVVGSTFDGQFGNEGARAFVWRNGDLSDLNDLVQAELDGWTLTRGISVNNLGQILAEGVKGDQTHTFLLNAIDGSRKALALSNGGTAAFSKSLAMVPSGKAVGYVSDAAGDFSITRANGSIEIYGTGDRPQLFLNDVLETSQGGSANLTLDDGSTFSVPADAKVSMDEFAVGATATRSTPPAEQRGSILRQLFVYTSEFVGNPGERRLILNPPYAGIRGDAAEFMNPETLDVSVKMNVGSPVRLSTVVDVPDVAFDLSFEAAFLSSTGLLQVFLDENMLGSFSASAERVGRMQDFSLSIDDPDLLILGKSRLAFVFDGPTGSQLIIDDVSMPGVVNGRFSAGDAGWFKDGPGTLELVATIGEERLAQITAVPEPATYLMMLGGLTLMGVCARRGRAA